MLLLILSQVILSMQLSFAVSNSSGNAYERKVEDGWFMNLPWIKISGWAMGIVIAVLNAFLLWLTFTGTAPLEAYEFRVQRSASMPWMGRSINRKRRGLSGLYI
jgi:hypothetical protein